MHPLTRILDAHHHLWHYSEEAFPWISNAMPALRRDHLIEEFEAVADQNGVVGAISVQARQTIEETEWLLQVASRSELIVGVVGWLPLTESRVKDHLERYANDHKLVGLRHIVQDEPDPHYLSRPDFNAGIVALQDFNLTYDLLVRSDQLPAAIQFVDAHPNQIFVLDHMAKPPIASGQQQPWARHLRQLAERENVCCKLSGMVTEANWQHWDLAALQPYFDMALACFGPDRLLFGSDWPVLQLASSYERWLEAVLALIAPLSETEATRILHGTAEHIYCNRSTRSVP